jgi:putative transposase
MPDHIHLFCTPGSYPPTSLKSWVSFWRRLVSRAVLGFGPLADAEEGHGGTCPSRVDRGGLWQRDFWDTQMRSRDMYSEKLAYVRMNPVRKGLVKDMSEWPYQGHLFEIKW